MKKWLLILILTQIIFTGLSAKLVILEFKDGTSYKCEPLYCSDSLLYVWTGIDKFNLNFVSNNSYNNIQAVRISDLKKIMLRIPKRMAQSAKTAFTSTLFIGGAITLINFRNQDITSILGFNGIFNIIFGSGITLLLDMFTHVPKNLDMTKSNKLDRNLLILRNYCMLQTHLGVDLINKMIQGVQP